MATFKWISSSGSFSLGSNWDVGAPPGAADTASFTANAGTISGNGTVGTLSVTGGGPWVWAGTVAANDFTANATSTISGAGLWTLTGTPTNSNYIVVGSGTGGQGSLTVSGGGKINSTQAASTTSFGLYVGSGTSSAANGTLLITGSGSSVNTGPNGAAVGQAGTGTMTVTAGATATFSTTDSSAISALAVGRAGTGTINVTGAGSTLTASGYVYVGRAGTATLNVTQGGTFTGGIAATSTTVAYGVTIGDGTPTLDANGNPNSPLYFGGTATTNVTGASTLHSIGNLRVGYRGSIGNLVVDTSSTAISDSEVIVGGGTDRTGAAGTVTVQGSGTLKSGGARITGSAGIVLGNDSGTTGVVTVSGSGSTLDANGDRLTVGGNGIGTLTLSGGGKAVSGASYSDVEAAFAVAGGAGSMGTVTITGTGSQLIASGHAVIGGNEKGAGPTAGGTGTVSVAGGGLLQTGAMTIEAGSSVSVDQASSLVTPSININGGTANLFTLTNSTAVSFGTGGTLSVHVITGANTVGNFTYGDKIDFVGTTAVALSNDTISTSTGSIAIGAAPANASYNLFADGSGGTFVALTPQTIGVFRFFDTNFGTHFYTADPNEEQVVLKTRPDLVPEGPGGVGLQAVSTASNDPNAAPVYRFFDTLHGTHFFTASASERDTVINTRPDLTYEPTSLFYEHTQSQPGDIPVYRFFDNKFGTHFYTDDATERATILNTRPDLVSEGIGFYEPPKNSAMT